MSNMTRPFDAIVSKGQEPVKLWEADRWQDMLTLEGQAHGFASTVFSPTGNGIIWGSQTTLDLWRAP